MSESLLSISEVLLFGRLVNDLEIKGRGSDEKKVRLATADKIGDFNDIGPQVDGVSVVIGNNILVRRNTQSENGIYTVSDGGGEKKNLINPVKISRNDRVFVEEGDEFEQTYWEQTKNPPKQHFKEVNPGQGKSRGRGQNNFLDDQLGVDAKLARIYGFSFEGTYYELPNPTLLLVHGDGDSAIGSGNTNNPIPAGHGARAPLNPSVTGVASADYQISDDIRVWAYDKADYTIRMDVMTGMFEQVLLDIYFGFDEPGIAGAKVSGAKVSGAKVSGAKVSGAKVSGAKARGPGD